MDYEKKYKEALNKAKELMTTSASFDRFTIERIFPELKESEDERIMKSLKILLQHFYNGYRVPGLNFPVSYKEMLDWLEKQGEQKPQGKTALEAINEEKVDNANKVETKDYSSIDPHFGKPIDEVEPKFNEGDWIVHRGTEDIYYIVAVINNRYHLKCGNNYTRQKCIDVDRSARLWDVTKDTKNGDILVYNNSIFIFNEIYKNCLIYYGIYEDNKFHDDKSYSSLVLDTIDISNIHPATKEQRDLLFQKIKETGYKWDADKKELRKIEKSHTNKVGPKFKVGDWIIGKATNNEPRQISEITDQCYKSTYGGQYGFSFEDELHLWSIKDAKPGDTLASKDGKSILIFRHLSLDDDNTFLAYYSITFSPYNMQGFDDVWFSTNFVPATKEQRDLLLQKMTEAGYEYNAEKEQLRTTEEMQELVEQNPVWSEEDKKTLERVIKCIENHDYMNINDIHWLKSLKNRVGCETNCTTTKKWKPSDEQIKHLTDVVYDAKHKNRISTNGYEPYSYLYALLMQLKKLKGE